jgi:integrase
MTPEHMGVKVRFQKGAWWLVIDHKWRRRSKKIGDRETANITAKKVREALVAGDLRCTVPETAQTLVEGYASEWLNGLKGNLKASTVNFYSDNLRRYVLPFLGTRAVGDLTRRDCRAFIAETRAKGLKLNTVKGIVRTLSALLSQAVEDEKLPANPALRLGKYLRRGDEEATEIQPLDTAQAALLVTTAERYFGRWHPWLLCAVRTGMRLGELLALQWGDIDWNDRSISVRRNIVRGTLTTPKSHRRRRVDVTPQLAEVLLAWRRVQRQRWLTKGEVMPDWVFPSLTGTPVEERNVRYVFKRVLEKAGTPPHPHPRPAAHVRDAPAPSGRTDHLRERAAWAPRRVDLAARLRALPAERVEPRGRSPRHDATIRNPRATGGGFGRPA